MNKNWNKCGCGSTTCPINEQHAKDMAAEQAMLERRDARPRKLRCYYAHCLAIYNTPQEQRDVDQLVRLGFDVINPNCPQVATEFAAYKAANPMDYMSYFKELVATCDVTAFRALPDGSIPAGVAKEIAWSKEVFELPSAVIRRTLSLEETRQYLAEIGQR